MSHEKNETKDEEFKKFLKNSFAYIAKIAINDASFIVFLAFSVGLIPFAIYFF